MKKISSLAFWLLLAVNCYAQNTPSISFEKQIYYIEEGQSGEVCVTLKNMEDATGIQDIFMVNNSINSQFLNFQSKSLPLTNGTFCFEMNTNVPDGEINYQNTDVLEIVSESETLNIGPIALSSVVLQDDVSSQAPKNQSPVLIKGFDNKTSAGDGFSLSLITTVPINSGTSFVVSNSNYSEIDGWLPKGNEHEYIEIHWNGNQTIEPGSIICLTAGFSSSSTSLGNEEGLVILLNGESIAGFNTNSSFTDNFLSSPEWSNIYILSGRIDPYVKDNILIYDGITYGIPQADFPFDIPFENESFQLFIGEQNGDLYGYVLCSDLADYCDIIAFLKNLDNWIYGEGTDQDELIINDLCSDLCDITFCPDRDLVVTPVCFGDAADVIFVLDESGSIVVPGEFDDIKSIVMNTSESLNCMSENLRFAVVAFSGTGTYHIVQNFEFGDINLDNYIPQSGGTDVSSAYTDLLSDLDNNILDVRNEADLQVILLTDAPHTTYLPFQPFNDLKDSPHDATHTVVYFEDYQPALSASAAAAIASKGEPYNGTIQDNPDDPEGPGGPRRLFVYESIEPNIAESLSILSNCNQINLSLEPYKEIVNSQILVSEGGEIIAQTGEASFTTNGIGTYEINVVTEDNCDYVRTYSFSEIESCVDSPQIPLNNKAASGKKTIDNHTKYEESNVENRNKSLFDAQILPNPAIEFVTVYIENTFSEENENYEYTLYTSSGRVVQKDSWNKKTNTLSVEHLSQGLYTIQIVNSKGNTIIKKFVVAKF